MNYPQRQRRRAMAEINVVPYIDVMLVLLVIFMVTAPLLNQGVEVELPSSQAKLISKQEKDPLIVSVDAKGQLYLNIAAQPSQPQDANAIVTQVSAELQQAKQKGQERQVLVKGDKNVDYGKVVEAMVLLQQAGAPSVGLITEPQA
jgi:biopolymer transport protein TolR